MKLDDISQKQLIVSLASAVVILLAISSYQSYMIQSLLDSEARVMPKFESVFITSLDSYNCKDLQALESDITSKLPSDKGNESKSWDNEILKHIQDRCG